FTGIKQNPDTLIQTLSSGLRVAPDGLRADNIVLDIPSIGSFTGNGVVGNNNSLDFQMLLKLSDTSGNMLGNLGGFSQMAKTQGIPFLIQGRTSSPVFLPAVGSSLKGMLQNALQPSQGNNQQGTDQQQQPLKGLLDQVLGGNDKKKKQ